ncbi:hypothetical protein NP233_g2709 [Leucocoprinus birnbaumii]|uniref:Uncharacterized protein n=1 Tax=Leucocoprinus birnbaumii TaxID=56174 RepID=A0AAD5YX31_9AGAR|nr:hypothetical protein NP233_g2709 [Leucocoprinus birnbaumii]
MPYNDNDLTMKIHSSIVEKYSLGRPYIRAAMIGEEQCSGRSMLLEDLDTDRWISSTRFVPRADQAVDVQATWIQLTSELVIIRNFSWNKPILALGRHNQLLLRLSKGMLYIGGNVLVVRISRTGMLENMTECDLSYVATALGSIQQPSEEEDV